MSARFAWQICLFAIHYVRLEISSLRRAFPAVMTRSVEIRIFGKGAHFEGAADEADAQSHAFGRRGPIPSTAAWLVDGTAVRPVSYYPLLALSMRMRVVLTSCTFHGPPLEHISYGHVRELLAGRAGGGEIPPTLFLRLGG